MEEIKGQLTFRTSITSKYNIIAFISMIAIYIRIYLKTSRQEDVWFLSAWKYFGICLLLFLLVLSIYYLLNPIKIVVNDHFLKINKGKSQKILEWQDIKKIKAWRSGGISIYDVNNNKTYIDFRTTNYADIKEKILHKHKESRKKAT